MIRLIPIWCVCLLLGIAACARDTGFNRGEATPESRPIPSAPAAATAGQPAAPTWPALDREPELRVLIAKAPLLNLRLLVPTSAPDRHRLEPGNVVIRPWSQGISIDGRHYPEARVPLEPQGGGPAFAYGTLRNSPRFNGRPMLVRVRDEVALVEQVPLETYLAGVLPAEMGPDWPEAALGAQAIVARSYAAARWQARPDADWHMLRGTADMAYDGARQPSTAVAAACASTRGELLSYRGQAILARFHAASGGRTEASEHLWPDATLVDGQTPLSRFMASVEDPASEPGATAMHNLLTHHRWRASFTLERVTKELQAWAAEDKRRPRIGQVKRIAIGSRHADSGRVATVQISHRLGSEERTDTLDALTFRLAVGANQLRSTWWDSCATGNSQVVIEGRGFGHGVGMPQVSAWWLAKQGGTAEDIINRYYPGATLARLWR